MKTRPIQTPFVESHLDERPYARIGFIALTVTFVGLLGWAALAPLHSAVVAGGRVFTASDNKVVQHLDGGLVSHIAVRDGDLVATGQLLLSLDERPLRIRLDQVQEQLLEVQANLERLAAEREGSGALRFSQALQQLSDEHGHDDILDTQQRLFASRRAAFTSEQQVLAQRQLQIQKQLEGGASLLDTQRRRLSLIDRQLAALRKGLERQAVSEARVRETESELFELRGEILTQEGEMARLREALAEAEFSASLRQQEYLKDVIGQQRNLQTRRIDLQAQELDLIEQLDRVEVRAPVAGKVKGFQVVTLGAVISAGQGIMEIVPQEHAFKIHARISPIDIDSVHPGLNAEVRFPAFHGMQSVPSVFASVLDVSSDVYIDEASGDAYYKASLVLDGESLALLSSEQRQLVAGMPVDLVIRTGQRTLAEYLVQPLSDMLARAFNEA